jgi:hypothetical protein
LCDVPVVFDFVFELVVLDEIVEFVYPSSPLLVFVCVVVRENIVNAANSWGRFVAALQTLEPALLVVSVYSRSSG